MNTYIDVFVDELALLEEGVKMYTYKYPAGITVHAWLLCVAPDLKGAKKIGGFPALNSFFGCHKCLIR